MSESIILVQPRGHASVAFAGLKAARLATQVAIREALGQLAFRTVWIVPSVPAAQLLLAALPRRPLGDQRLLALEPVDGKRHSLLHVLFRYVLSAEEGSHLLPTEELIEVLGSESRADLFIGAAAALDSDVILFRGDLEPLIVPVSWFRSRADGPKPDLTQVAITDYGQTVRLGEYEAATDAILYEFDPAYRRRAKKRRLESDRSLGGALRRLRLQKGLRQSDFPGLTAKEIARIERGEVKKPHQRTLNTIAKRFGIPAHEISSF